MTSRASISKPPALPSPVDPPLRIVAAARRSFLAHGFSRFTMDDLAEQLGMSKKTLYAHFPTKDALVAAVIEDKVTGFKRGVQAIVETPGLEFTGRAHRLIAHVVTQMGEISPVFFRDLERHLPELYARIEAVRREILLQVWGRMLADGAARGHVRRELEAPFVAEMVALAVEGLLRPAALARLNLAPRDVVTRVLSTIFTGILTPAGRRAYEHFTVF